MAVLFLLNFMKVNRSRVLIKVLQNAYGFNQWEEPL